MPLALLAFLPFALHIPLWLLGRSADPIWFFSGLTQSSSTLGKPVIDPNVGFTSEALGRLVAWDWFHGVIPWWNAYTGIGMPLAGELQPGAFFLPFNLLLWLSKGILWQQILMQIIAGLATYALLRELGLSRLSAWMAGALFSLNGTFAWAPGPAAVYCTQAFLPALLLGIELARRQQRGAASVLMIGFATAWSILAGFPETAYISSLPVLAWGVYRLSSASDPWAMSRRAIIGLVLGMLVTAPLLIAFVDYVRQSDSFGIHNAGETFLPGAAFSATLMPYSYGSLGTTLSSIPLSNIWATIGGYTSPLILVLAVVGVTGKSAHRGLKFLLLGWILLAGCKTFGVRPVMALMNHIPLMRQANFLRYAPPSWELAIIILAAFGLDEFRNRIPRQRGPFGIVTALLAVGVVLAWPQRVFWDRPQALIPLAFIFLALSATWALSGLLVARFFWKRWPGAQSRLALAFLLVFDAAIMFLVPQSSSVRGGQIDTPAMQFLSDHLGLSRIYSLGPIQPNYSAYFRVASINHNVEPVPKLWAEYVESSLLPGFSKIDSSETFWSGVMPSGEGKRALSQHLASYLDLGVRYVVTKSGQSPMPTVLVPPADPGTQSGASGRPSVTPRLKKLWTALERCRSIANDPAKPAIERFVAKSLLKAISKNGQSMVGESGLAVVTNGAGALDTDSILLHRGESAEITVPAPPPVTADSPITSVGTVVGNSESMVDGDLAVEICAETVCRSGQRPLAGSTDDTFFQVPLDKPLATAAGTPLRLVFSHQGGSRPLLFRSETTGGMSQQIKGPDGLIPGHTIQIELEYGTALPGLRKSYTDSLMDIWELPNPAPYFQVIQGGPCALLTMQRENLTAECAAPATLIRRELFMPGWRVTVNGTAVAAVQQSGIFQSTALPVGRSHVQYRFTPPYVEFGWAASIVGIAGLAWQAMLLGPSLAAAILKLVAPRANACSSTP